MKKLEDGRCQAVGRRKTSVARVYISHGKGEWDINGRALADYFPRSAYHNVVDQYGPDSPSERAAHNNLVQVLAGLQPVGISVMVVCAARGVLEAFVAREARASV